MKRKRHLFLIFFIYILKIYSDSIYEESIKNIQEYLSIDTSNPPGVEIKTALFLKRILDQEGIENTIFPLEENRANFYAILRGNGSKKGIILFHHMDVVPAQAHEWSVPPFSGKIVNGFLYGRGTIDMKTKGIIDLMTMIHLKRKKISLNRDIILLAVADEEVNSMGSRWMVKNKPELLKNAEFLIDEGASVICDQQGNTLYYGVSIGEKSPLWLTLIFRGTPGHGSVPYANSAVNQAIKAASRILEAPKSFVVLPSQSNKIKLLLENQDITKIPGYTGDWDISLKNKQFLEEIAKNALVHASISNTISITCMKAGNEINTIPSDASISLDCRLLPGVEKDKFISDLRKIINNDAMEVKIEEYILCTSSPCDTTFFRALEVSAKKRGKNAIIAPSILLSSTDSSFYRTLGIHAYGFEPYRLTLEETELSHKNDERIKVENIGFGIDLLSDIIIEMQ